MSTAPRFSIRYALLLTTLIAFSTLPLAAPSKWWMYLLPAMSCLLSVFVISRFDISPARGQVFWLSMFVGVAVYLAAVTFVTFVCQARDMRLDVWGDALFMPLWTHIHGVNTFRTNPKGFSTADFMSFFVYIHVLFALIIATTAAGVAQFAAYRRESPICGKAGE